MNHIITLLTTGGQGANDGASIRRLPDGAWTLHEPRCSPPTRFFTPTEQRVAETLRHLYESGQALRSHQDAVACALRSVAVQCAGTADRDPYNHGLANGLRMALDMLNGTEFVPIPSPHVYRVELATWGGRYRWLRTSARLGVLRSAWMACTHRVAASPA